MDQLSENVRRNIRRLRRLADLTQTDVAAKIGTTRQRVSALEAGQGETTTLEMVERLATGFGVQAADLIAEPDCPRCQGQPPAGFMCTACGSIYDDLRVRARA